MKRLIYITSLILLLLTACIEDGISTSPSDQPTFSTDTLDMGLVYTDQQTSTYRFTVYNRHPKGINLSDIRMSGASASLFRINVDGMSGVTFNDIEIRANDSIFVFVSADLPTNGSVDPIDIDASLDFTTNGVVKSVVIAASGQDITRVKAQTLTDNTTYCEGIPYQISDSLVVAEGATLTLQPGTRLLFHDGARLIVRGTLQSLGTAEKPVKLTGDRTGNVITDVSFDLMSRQWGGIDFMDESTGNALAFTDISNTSYGVRVWGDGQQVEDAKVVFENCRLRNSGGDGLYVIGASVQAYGCEFSDAAGSLVYLVGGNHRFDHCTAANYYLFAAIGGPAWYIGDPKEFEDCEEYLPTAALITNTITYGLGSDVYPGDLTGREVYFNRCMFRSDGTDDDNFIDSLWDSDPLYYTVREDYVFDYRLQPESPAIGVAYPYLTEHPLETDYYGQPRTNDLGAYVYVAPAE